MKARVHKSKPRKRQIRACKAGTATDAIGTLEKGAEIYGLTMGQFSFIDVLVAVLRQTGPAHINIATWTAANADLTTAARLLENAEILSIRFVVDRSFLARQPAYCAKMRELFGDACIRPARSHAKFTTIRNDSWNIVIRTSMNLNLNPRMENFEISDDKALCDFMGLVVDEIYQEHDEGVFDAGTVSEVPLLASIPNVERPNRPRMGKITKLGQACVAPPREKSS